MPEPFNYFGGGANDVGSIPDAVNSALFNGQKLQANQAQLDEQSRANAAREAAAQIATHPHLDDGQFNLLLQPIAQADPNAAAQLRRQRDMQTHLQTLLTDASPANIARFGMAYPEQLEPIKKAWDVLDSAQRDAVMRTNADVYALLGKGYTKAAKAVLEQHEAADRKAGVDTSSYAALHDLIDTNPQGALALSGMSLSTGMGHDKFADSFKAVGGERRADELQPAFVREQTAKASKAETEAQFAPQAAQSDLATEAAQRDRMAAQTANEIAANRIAQGRLALDQDALTTNTQLKLQELGANSVKADPGSTQIMNQAAGESVASQQSAQVLKDMAGKFRALGQAGVPAFTNTAEWFKRTTGNQDAYSQVRNEYSRLINSEAMKGRANMPGAMSDADRKFLMQGLPPATASGIYLSHWLEAMAHAQEGNARLADRKAGWISANGNLGTAKGDLEVGGVKVPQGTSFPQFMGQVGAADNRGAVPAGIAALADKYGH